MRKTVFTFLQLLSQSKLDFLDYINPHHNQVYNSVSSQMFPPIYKDFFSERKLVFEAWFTRQFFVLLEGILWVTKGLRTRECVNN